MSPNPFLPKGYEPPAQSGGRYLKITKNSEARVRIVSPSPILGWEYWTDDNKPRRLRERPATIPSDVRTSDDGSPEKLRHFWAMAVLDYADSTVKIWEVTQATIQRTIADLAGDEDWGHPSGYDLKIKRDDAIGRTTYAVAPVPHKPLSADAKRIVTETAVNLDALFDGGDPFIVAAIKQAPAPPEEPTVGPMTPDTLRRWLADTAHNLGNEPPLSDGWRKAIVGHLTRIAGGETGRHAFTSWAFGQPSTVALTDGQWHALRAWLDIRKADDGKYYPSELATAEAKLVALTLNTDDSEPMPF